MSNKKSSKIAKFAIYKFGQKRCKLSYKNMKTFKANASRCFSMS